MMSLLTVAGPSAVAEDRVGFEPGLFTLVSRIVEGVRKWDQTRRETAVIDFIAAHGGRLTDDIERRLGVVYLTGRF